MRMVLIGASGQLGSAIVDVCDTDGELLTPTHAELDALDPRAVRSYIESHRPTVVVNCMAFHNVDQCEKTPAPAFEANALAVDMLAETSARVGAAFATISTDYVFDGTLGRAYTEHDAPNPRTAYGASKLAGELLTRRHGPQHFIIRTSGVYAKSGTSNKGYTFIERILQQAERGEAVRVVDDMTFSPSYAPHIAKVLLDVIARNAFGTHHIVGRGSTTWFEFARRALESSGLAADLQPLSSASFNSNVKRPLYSALESLTLSAAGVAPAPEWQQGLDAFLAERAARLSASS